MELAAVLLVGLTAGGTSCAAVQGGLLAGVVVRHAGCAAHERAGPGIGGSVARPGTLRSDAEPVAGFLVGKLASHALLGAMLGLAGATVSIGALARGAVQVTAGALVLVLGLGQVGAPGLRRLAGVRLAGRDRCRQGVPGGMVAAAGAGLATVLVPCGVTVVVEALAATSGSAVAGAAVMSVFVIGTWPLFGLLGLVARRAVTAWHGRLRVFTGAAVVVAGLWTAVGGLAVAGVPGDPLRWIGGAAPPTGPGGSDRVGGDVVAVAGGRQTVTVTVRSNGFDPAEVAIHAGLPTTLVLRARHATGCIRTVVIAGRNGEWVLPADGDTRVDLGVPAHGVVRYSCVMGMYSARLTAG